MTLHDVCNSETSRVLVVESLQRLKVEALIPTPANCEAPIEIYRQLCQVSGHTRLDRIPIPGGRQDTKVSPTVWSSSSSSSSWVSYPRAGPSLQEQEPRLQFCRKQAFHQKLRNQGCSFTRYWIGAVDSRCFPHPTLSLASEQALKIWKDPRGTNVQVKRVDLTNWARRTPPKFTTGVKYQFHQGFWPDKRSGNPNYSSPPTV